MTELGARLAGLAMMAAGAVIAAVFGGGLIVFLWVDVAALLRGQADIGRLMGTLLMGPIVGGAPALLGVALALRGWRRLRPPTEEPDPDGG